MRLFDFSVSKVNKMRFKKLCTTMIVVMTSGSGIAENVSMNISESGMTISGSSSNQPKSSKSSATTYLSKKSSKRFNPNNAKDNAELATSVEFEIYQITENQVVHTVFESGIGICRGFRSKDGVKITDSATYYLKKGNRDEYYVSITGAVVKAGSPPINMQYVPIFNISQSDLSKQVREEEARNGKSVAERNIRERMSILSKVICP